LLWLLLGSLVLLYGGLYNGFPLVTYDTGTYLGSGMSGVVPDDRPITYGLFTRLAGLNFSLWFVIFFQCLVLAELLLRYLAVAHFGRGRGEWAQGESPAHWREVVQRALAVQRDALAMVWHERDGRSGTAQAGSDETSMMAAALAPLVAQAASDALASLYPGAAVIPVAASEPLRESAQAGPQASR